MYIDQLNGGFISLHIISNVLYSCFLLNLFHTILIVCTYYLFIIRYVLYSCLSYYVLTTYSTIVSWGSKATPSATPFFKTAYKVSHLPRLGMLCLALPARRKVQKLDFQSEFSMSKIISLIFFHWRTISWVQISAKMFFL